MNSKVLTGEPAKKSRILKLLDPKFFSDNVRNSSGILCAYNQQ